METVLETQQEDKEEHDKEPTKLEGSLSDLYISDPQQRLPDVKAAEACPESYRVNSANEIRLLAIADSFHHQYSHLYPNSKPLFLSPVNECGIKKFVSTTLRPTLPMFPRLLKWEACASFVANFLSLELLESPVDLPKHLYSPTFVRQRQKATCFEYATMLCSLLLGANYDAYCVSGYAVKEMCLLDQSMEEYPVMDAEFESVTTEQEPEENKYTMLPVQELSSRFLMQQEKKKEQEAELVRKQKEEEERKAEEPPPDPLRALWVHCWVLVMSGSHNIQENFFIDPLTGKHYPTDSDKFLGIESVWNNFNYHVNMQDCVNGCTEITFDLDDLTRWEPVLYGAVSLKELKLDVQSSKTKKKSASHTIIQKRGVTNPQLLDMPRSWVSALRILKEDLDTCWPGGERVFHYRKAVLEKFAPCKRSDGLLTRLTRYKDLKCTEITKVQMWYEYREDHLERKEINKLDGITTEHFKEGRSDHLLFHRYSKDPDRVEMKFSRAHINGLASRVESQREVTETFQGREDGLYYRYALLGEPPSIQRSKSKMFDLHSNLDDFPLLKVIERYHRDSSKPANKDVAKRVFISTERKIELTYHCEDHQFIPSQMHFYKPREATLWTKGEDFRTDMVSIFQVDPSEKPLGLMNLYEMLEDLIAEEKKVARQVKESKEEASHIIASRDQEQGHVRYSPWVTLGAAKIREEREEMERQAEEEEKELQQREHDILGPFLIQLGNPVTLEPEVGKTLVKMCLQDYKTRLNEYAQLIQEFCEKDAKELEERQQRYQREQFNISKVEEEEYQEFCAMKTLQISVAQKILADHEETAPQRIEALYERLKQDPRVSKYLTHACL